MTTHQSPLEFQETLPLLNRYIPWLMVVELFIQKVMIY
jgi:hypothetical protein